MSKAQISAKLFITLILFWMLLNGTFALDSFIVGVGASLIIVYFFRDSLSFLSEFRFTPQALMATLSYVAFFLKELVKSNLRLARIVLEPDLPINPGIVKVRTKLKSRMGRLLLANSITLTPGTLTIELEDEWLYIHWVTLESADIEGATQAIVEGFERHLEVMYG
ncbi:MAG: hypothetical protein C0605_06315 [Hyphomicrobiales bacterium]|nr:MAG: hypothetical protein C0605_06315 [Hyphomicrobiales bacterium]